MYISKKGTKTTTQLELGDFFGQTRKIIFDLDDPKDARKAQRVMKPKGIKPRRKRSKPPKKLKQAPLQEILPPTVLKPAKSKMKKTTAAQSIVNNTPAVSSNLVSSKKKTSSETKPSVPKTIPLPSPEPVRLITGWSGYVPSEIYDLVGDGGDLEVLCPYCKDLLSFHYDNIDVIGFKHTRLCDCGALVRISIRKGNKAIFRDIKFPQSTIPNLIRSAENDVRDEYGNAIYSYAIPQ
jgi:hypothetical protein